MRIEVTADDIAKGKRKSCDACPVARAIHRATGDGWNAVVYKDNCIAVADDDDWDREEFTPPPEVAQFVKDFDAGRPVTPITFDLPIDELVGGGA